MCGIFGGTGLTLDESKKAINLINRGDDGITIKEIKKNIIFTKRITSKIY